MREAGVVLGESGEAIYWHLPDDRSGGAIPDSRPLWEVLWENRKVISGFAHSHPGSGVPLPSPMDITTFEAIEKGLGRRLKWWITSQDQLSYTHHEGGGPTDYVTFRITSEHPAWLDELRRLSYT
jgi:hypothetical protein